MRICFTSDLHGHAALYDQLDALLRTERPDLLILGGDLFVDGDLVDPVDSQVRYVTDDFMPRVRRWRDDQPQLNVACILGNHDWLCTESALRERHRAGEIALLDEHRPLRLGDVSFIGYSCTPPTPYWVKDFERLDRSSDAIPEMGGAVWDAESREARKAEPHEHFGENPSIEADLAASAGVNGRWILVAHAPPHDSKLDSLPHVPHPIGSRAVRSFVEERQPLASLHGHIHESPSVTGAFAVPIGATLSINPGQSQTRLHAVTLDSDAPRETLRHTVYW